MMNKAEKTLEHFIDISRNILSIEGVEAVSHYFKHDEFEMCFEGLIIELMSNNLYPDRFNFAEWKNLAVEYGLDENSVFDGFFWRNFNQWGNYYDKENY